MQDGEANNPYTTAAGAKHGLALLDKLGLGEVVLVGHSAGAPVALELAALAPERVKGLVLIAPAVFLDSPLANASLSTYVNLAYTQAMLRIPGVNVNFIRAQILEMKAAVETQRQIGYYDKSLITDEVRHRNRITSVCGGIRWTLPKPRIIPQKLTPGGRRFAPRFRWCMATPSPSTRTTGTRRRSCSTRASESPRPTCARVAPRPFSSCRASRTKPCLAAPLSDSTYRLTFTQPQPLPLRELLAAWTRRLLFTPKPRIAEALPLPWRSQEALGDRAEYVELDSCGHLPMDECPDRLNAVVIPFVSRVMRRDSPRVSAQLSATKPVVERSSDAAAGASSST